MWKITFFRYHMNGPGAARGKGRGAGGGGGGGGKADCAHVNARSQLDIALAGTIHASIKMGDLPSQHPC